MIKIGITGGIGSGKSTVCKVWKSLGAYIINADDLAKKIMTDNESVRQEITQTFGSQSYNKDDSLNRAYLARQAFEKGRVDKLNAIVHPRIPPAVENLMEKAETQNYKALVYEAALLLQDLRPDYLDHIVLVMADEEKRIQRVRQRDGVDGTSVRDRMNKQQDFSRLTDQADSLIRNNSSLQSLERRAEVLFNEIVSAFAD